MQDHKGILKELIQESGLAPHQKATFWEFLFNLPESNLKKIISLFYGSPESIKYIYLNSLQKSKAFLKKDRNLWTNILSKEIDLLEKIKGKT